MSGETKLLPCPFCGGKAATDCENGLWTMGCIDADDTGCPASITWGHYPRKAQAITAWNTRPAHDDLTKYLALALGVIKGAGIVWMAEDKARAALALAGDA